MYGNEAEVGRGIRASGVPRSEIFVSTSILVPCVYEFVVWSCSGALSPYGAMPRHIDDSPLYLLRYYGEQLKTFQYTTNNLQITGKLWNTDHDPENVGAALDRSLKDLQTEYLDLYLVGRNLQEQQCYFGASVLCLASAGRLTVAHDVSPDALARSVSPLNHHHPTHQ